VKETRAGDTNRDRGRLFYACCEDLSREGAWTVHIREVVNNWERLGVRVTLFAPRIWPFSVRPECEVIYIPTIDVRIVREYLFLMLLPFYVLLFGLRQKPRAVYCREMSFMPPIAWAAHLLGIPMITEINGFMLKDLEAIGAARARLAIFRFLQRMNLNVTDGLVFAGKSYLDYFRREYSIDEGKVNFVPNGVDTDLFSPGQAKAAARSVGLSARRRYVTFVGTFYPHSLTPVIVGAAARIVTKYPEVDFLMVGEGHDLPRCREEADRLGIAGRVLFPGMKKNHEIPAYLGASAILLNLVEGTKDIASMKLLEYMSAGGAVVVNGDSAFGVPLSHRGNCYVIERTDADALAAAIETLLDDDGLRRRLGEGARAFILSRFSWERTARRLLSVIDDTRERR
jgi:glycosyltransferase involved in cell wall biosynthesis